MSEDEYDALTDEQKAEVDKKRLEIKKERLRRFVLDKKPKLSKKTHIINLYQQSLCYSA